MREHQCHGWKDSLAAVREAMPRECARCSLVVLSRLSVSASPPRMRGLTAGVESGSPVALSPRKKRVRGSGNVFRRPGTRFWWIRYFVHGKRQDESSRSTKKTDAISLLRKRLEEARWLSEAPKRMTMNEALKEYGDDAELRGS